MKGRSNGTAPYPLNNYWKTLMCYSYVTNKFWVKQYKSVPFDNKFENNNKINWFMWYVRI